MVTAAVVPAAAAATIAWLLLASHVGTAARLVLELLALAGWGAVMLAASRHTLSARPLWLAGALLIAAAVVVAPIGSRDIWAFVMQGRIVAVHHASPYLHRPSAFPHDSFLRLVAPGWRHSRSPYGPLFTAVSGVLSLVAGDSVLGNRMAFQALAGVALAGAAWGQQRRNNTLGVAFLLLNPMCIAIVNGGHSDLAVGALLAAAVHVARKRERPLSAVIVGLLLAAAVLVKLPAAVAVVAIGVWVFRHRGRAAVATTGAVCAATVGAAYAAVGGRDALVPLLKGGTRISRVTIAGVLNHMVGPDTISAGSAASAGAAITIVAVAVIALRGTRTGSASVAATTSVVVLFVAAPYVLPWYVGMALPLAADQPRRICAVTATVMAACLWLAYTDPPGSATGSLSNRLSWLPFIGLAVTGLAVAVVAIRSSRSGHRLPV